MPDITAITTILSSVKSAAEIAKLLKESGLSLEQAEIKLKLAELIGALADAKMQIAEVRELLLEKDEVIRNLTNELAIKASLVYESPYYWLNTDGEKDGPYCASCQDDKQKLARLIESAKGYWTCCVCGKHFMDKNYTPQTIQKVHSKGWIR